MAKSKIEYKSVPIFSRALDNTPEFKSKVGDSFYYIKMEGLDDTKKDMVKAFDETRFEHIKREDVDWQAMLDCAMELKAIAQSKKIVMLVTSQATKASKEKDMPEDTDIYGGEALAQASNVLIMMGEDPDEPNVRYVSVAKRRAGEGFNKKIKINFSVDCGKIGI